VEVKKERLGLYYCSGPWIHKVTATPSKQFRLGI